MVETLDGYLVVTAREVFATMLNWPVEPVAQATGGVAPRPFTLLAINGNIGFGGQVTGSLFFSTSEALAGRIARQLLGEHIGAGEISDVIGELTNMLAGGCKSRLCDAGLPVVMSIPNVIRGSQIWANARDVEFMIHREFHLPTVGEQFQAVWLGKRG